MMKKLLYIFLPFLLLTGCGADHDTHGDVYQKQKDCANYRNEYSEYLNKKYNLGTKDYITISDFFFSEIYDKCIVAYEVIQYDEYDNEFHDYNIADAFEDESLYHDFDTLSSVIPYDYDENLKEIREHNDHTSKRLNQVNKYRTGKTREEE